MDKHTIRIVSPWLDEYDYKLASSLIDCEPGVVVVQKMPTPVSWGGIQVCATVDSHIGCDIGQVIACDPGTGFFPGQYVLTNWEEGKKMSGFQVGAFGAETLVVLYGRAATSKKSIRTNLDKSIFGSITVKQYPIIPLKPGDQAQPHKTISADIYESYHKAFEPCEIVIPSFDGDFVGSAQLPKAGSYRIRVKTNGIAKQLDVTLEVIGDVSRETINVIDREIPVRATGRNIIVELDDLRDRTEGGILLLNDDHSRSSVATVLSVGELVGMNRTGQYRQDRIAKGDRVIVMATGLRNIYAPDLADIKSVKITDEDSILCKIIEDEVPEAA